MPGLERGTLPGGRYLRARLRGEPPAVYERIGPTFEELMRQARPDESRPSIECYRRLDEIDLLLPVSRRQAARSSRAAPLRIRRVADRADDREPGRAGGDDLGRVRRGRSRRSRTTAR